jgi:hypothetical protein
MILISDFINADRVQKPCLRLKCHSQDMSD